MKIAIIGAGLSGLACALECEKLGVSPDVYERDNSVGWPWHSVNIIPAVLYRHLGDARQHVKNNYDIEVLPINTCKTIIMKSPNREIKIKGNMGIFFSRGKGNESAENQLFRMLRKSVMHFNCLADYRELASSYDFVAIATGRDTEARQMGVWKDEGIVNIVCGLALGSFHDETAILYLNKEYAGSGYARLTPFSPTQAIVALNNIGHDRHDIDRLFDLFLEKEKLKELEFLYRFSPPPFTTGLADRFQVGNKLLLGRSAGLVDRFIGVGGPEAVMSGVMAARAMIDGKDYSKLVKPLQDHIENVSSFRKAIEGFQNDDFDKLLSFLGAPGVKEVVYKSGLNFADMLGHSLKIIMPSKQPKEE